MIVNRTKMVPLGKKKMKKLNPLLPLLLLIY